MSFIRWSMFSDVDTRPQSDVCIVPCVQGQGCAYLVDEAVQRILETRDFIGNQAECAIVYPNTAFESRICLVGLGDMSMAAESLRIGYGTCAQKLKTLKVTSISVILPQHIVHEDELCAVMEALYYGLYDNGVYKTSSSQSPTYSIAIHTHDAKTFDRCQKRVSAYMEALTQARDLINKNADEITPDYFSSIAYSIQSEQLQVDIFDESWISSQKMGLLLAVARGSCHQPRFVQMVWNGNPGNKECIALVGKGITFDSGGLDLKGADNMKDMRTDMSGAASVLAVMRACKELQVPLNVVAAIPLCENSIGSRAYKPSDVYIARSGMSVEIANTDAEGRLILADALHYVKETFSPKYIVDVATLTGAAEVALGADISALFSNSDELTQALEASASCAQEPIWRMPLHKRYKSLLDSVTADCKNSGTRSGGAITAALFLQQFVGDAQWAHFDIAGTAFVQETRHYLVKGASGVLIRTLLTFLERQAV